MRNRITLGILGIILLLCLIILANRIPKPSILSVSTAPAVITIQTFQCSIKDGLPDKNCTPGAIDSNVTQNNIYQTICVKGYTKTVRPPVSYTNPLKIKIMQKYGEFDSPKNYELDHLIPLELGGNPDSEQNLWPEPYNSAFGARNKDEVENYLNRQVCDGKITLSKAQKEISDNWVWVWWKIK